MNFSLSYYNKRHQQQAGVAMLDSIIAISLFAVLFLGFLALSQIGLRLLMAHKARVTALELASARIEYIRSLPYASIGVQGDNPTGSLARYATTTANNIVFTTTTDINWVDDDSDGLSPADTNPHDYKEVDVAVSWGDGTPSKTVTLKTAVADFSVE